MADPPFQSIIFDNPQVKRRDRDLFWACTSIAQSESITPFSTTKWDNPRKKRSVSGFISRQPFQQQFSFPIASPSVTPNPIDTNRTKSLNKGFTQSRPSYYTEPVAATPRLRVEWPLPSRKRTPNRSLLTGSITTTNNPEPARFVNWVNPLRKRRINQDWIYNSIVTQVVPGEALPDVRQLLSIPQVKKQNLVGWIQSLSIITTADPLVPYDYPNPRKLKYPTETIIVNLLQNTLEPAAEAAPFYQTDYPNPRFVKYTATWLQDKKFYYEEPSLQIAQYDWPLFRPIRRSSVGFIYSQIQSSDPFFFTSDVVPLRKKIEAITFVDNPARFIIIPEGLQPFAQYDWPLFLKLKRFNSLITLASLSSRILPPIVGRILCLLADEAEYDLFAEDRIYDVRAAQTDYDLDADGRECQ